MPKRAVRRTPCGGAPFMKLNGNPESYGKYRFIPYITVVSNKTFGMHGKFFICANMEWQNQDTEIL